jgi:hypothetical protein
MRAIHSSAAVCLLLFTLCSCVERKEHLTIQPGGVVLYQVKLAADSEDDLLKGDAIPHAKGGWITERRDEADEDGRVTYGLIAESAFGPRDQLPSNFAIKTDRDSDLYLQFPTDVRIEQRADGEYYHFARTYEARNWATIAALEDRLVKAPLADLAETEPKNWTADQRKAVVRALANFETEKMLVFARAAFKKSIPDGPQDAWLAIRSHMHDCVLMIDDEALAKLLEPRENPAEQKIVEETIAHEAKKFQETMREQLKDAARTVAGLNGSQITVFMNELEGQIKEFEITQDLGDEKFEIRVELPGSIVATNADSIEGSTAVWSFDGQIIRDKQLELLATSRLR